MDLNKACPNDPYPLPYIDTMVDSTAGHELLTFLDASSGFNQIRMEPSDAEKIDFVTERGIYCYMAMPFGLRNAEATFQQPVNKMFKEHIGKIMEVYIDDMAVKSKNADDHVQDLRQVFDVLRAYNMKVNPSKCNFAVSSGMFLGHMVTRRGIEASTKQIKAISEITRFEWETRHEAAMEKLKKYLSTAPLLSKPIPGETLYVYLSVIDHAVSGVLVREEDGSQFPVYYDELFIEERVEQVRADRMNGKMVNTSGTSTLDFYGKGRTLVTIHRWCIHINGIGLGLVLKSPQGDTLVYSICCEFKATNNESEYEALIIGMTTALDLNIVHLEVNCDFLLFVNHVKGTYEDKDCKMMTYLEIVKKLQRKIDSFDIRRVPREKNDQADALAGAVSRQMNISNIPIIHILKPAMERNEEKHPVMDIEEGEHHGWTTKYKEFLSTDISFNNKTEATTFKMKGSIFCLIDGVFFKKSVSGLLQRCLEKA
ncbi:uncharacterized protein LOC141673631 [Apium graveolens]|uniref:uncharacterized protein LOC141673631 n=1 Tax=Apium graveolens TaxID=4045 RepID=UPI003D7B9FEA